MLLFGVVPDMVTVPALTLLLQVVHVDTSLVVFFISVQSITIVSPSSSLNKLYKNVVVNPNGTYMVGKVKLIEVGDSKYGA